MPCDTPVPIKANGKSFDVPCGKCPPCKLRRVQGWIFRLQQEEKRALCAHFVTFSYDTRTVPITENGYMTLNKDDLKNLFLDLKKIVPKGTVIKYYACGEYGGLRFRPHYHAIIFNVEDRSLYSKAWGKGHVYVGSVSGASIAYTLKYIDKPGHFKKHNRDDRLKEFSLMSKHIGDNYVNRATINYHNADIENNFLTEKGGKKIAMPRYYRTRLLSPEAREEQTNYIIQKTEFDNDQAREEYFRKNPNATDYDYDWHLHGAKRERYRRFYHRQKPRGDADTY